MRALGPDATEPFPALLSARFRANPDYTLVAHERLSDEWRELCAGLRTDRDHHGLLIPSMAVGAGVKAAGRDVARLFEALKRPSTLPDFLLDEPDDDEAVYPPSWRIARLLLDGIIEIESDGSFLGGPGALDLLSAAAHDTASEAADGVLADLSNEALRLALQLPGQDASEVSSWLYHCNTVPLTPRWVARLGRGGTAPGSPGDAFAGEDARALDLDYEASRSAAWCSWQHRARSAVAEPAHLGYKLYVSPRPVHLSRNTGSLVRTLVEHEVQAFKLGRGSLGLMRPDKLVIYARSREELERLGSALQRALGGADAQGVPFTAPLSDDGLLSWGMDPPPGVRLSGLRPDESWRTWLCSLLARALVHARECGLSAERALRYVRLRARLDGIDSGQWLPGPSVWREYGVLDEPR